MTLLAVDIGTKYLGWATDKNDYIEVGHIESSGLELYNRLDKLYWHLLPLFERVEPQIVGIEDVWIGPNKQVGLKLAKAFGVVAGLSFQFGASVIPVAPRTAKRALTGNGNASKDVVMAEASKHIDCSIQDEADAFAVMRALYGKFE